MEDHSGASICQTQIHIEVGTFDYSGEDEKGQKKSSQSSFVEEEKQKVFKSVSNSANSSASKLLVPDHSQHFDSSFT